jgi:2-iminobutanoate/2-iminopropanoate deaminase
MAQSLLGRAAVVLSAMIAAPALGAPPAALPFAEAVRAGDLLYLSGQIGAAPGSARPVAGGVAAEARQAMDNIGATLRRNGLDYADLVKCTVMLTDMKQWSAFNRVYAGYFPDGRYPARSAIGANALALGAGVEIECIARAAEPPRGINPGTPLGPYSQAVAANGLVYISGIVAFDAGRGRFADPVIEAQMRQLFANLDAVLAGAGLGRDAIVKTILFVKDAKDLPAINLAYAAYFSAPTKPARSTVPGADWGRPDIMIEMEAVAVARDRAAGEKP